MVDNLKSTYEFKEFIGKETKCKEYKKFTFNLAGIPIDIPQAEQYCENNLFDFNETVINNLFKYFEYFLLKYVCGYINSGIDGNFIIGVNDFGFIEGIPYQGNIPKKMIINKIYELLSNYLKFDNNLCLSDLVEIDFIKIKNIPRPTEEVISSYTQYNVLKENATHLYNNFLIKITDWRNQHSFVTQKLVDLVNNLDSRVEITQYIRENDPTSELISLLESDYILEYKSHDQIYHLKKEPNNIYYWVTKWKDEMSFKIRQLKPNYVPDNCHKSMPLNIITNVSDMIPYWVHNNSNIKIYAINIKIKKIPNLNCKYYDFYSKRWINCYRILLPNGEPEISNCKDSDCEIS
jgi:hypothetical protein